MEPDPYLDHMILIMDLVEAGYQVKNDDLTIEQWLDLNIIKKEIIRIVNGSK